MAEDPGVALAVLLGLLVVRVPADGGGIQQDFRAGQRHQACGFRVPLVPAHQHAEAADAGVDRLEAQVAGGEVELLRSEEHTSELQSLMRISYAVFCLTKKNKLDT